MIEYDSTIIYKYAQRLYSKATLVIFLCLILGAALSSLAGYAIANENPQGGIIGAVVGGILGLIIGLELSFMIRLKAQLALCQVKIEENTRG